MNSVYLVIATVCCSSVIAVAIKLVAPPTESIDVVHVKISHSPLHEIAMISNKKSHNSVMLNPLNISKNIMRRYDPALANEARKYLENNTHPGLLDENVNKTYGHKENNYTDVFGSVHISFPLKPPFIDHPPTNYFWEGVKNLVPPEELVVHNSCVIYGAGISDESSFESRMAALGCEVHAFDCTIAKDAPSVFNKSFIFHPWCLGFKQSFGKVHWSDGQNESEFVFKTLSDTMAELNHSKVDVLKFDIEGFEWNLFEKDILHNNIQPIQLSFELHTAEVNPLSVPKEISRGKDYKAVNNLFLKLFDLGYRVISKELNWWDPACAEFVLFNIFTFGNTTGQF